jgi:hypothetical protein
MTTSINKILKITKGLVQLFNAMDQGFIKVESDISLIKEFRSFCYYANENLEISHNTLMQLLNPVLTDQIPIDHSFINSITYSLEDFSKTLNNTFLTLDKFISDYNTVWKKNLSLEVLNEFRSVLEREQRSFEKEAEGLTMKLLLHERKALLSSPKTIIEKDE